MFSIWPVFTKLWAILKRRRSKMKFVNEAEPKIPDRLYKNPSMGFYHHSKPSKYLFQWSRLFQGIVSQAGTWIHKKAFHSQECGIHKCEGGCNIAGVGELVLGKSYCYFDRGRNGVSEDAAQRLADLITAMVLKFDPMDPIDSLLKAAAENIGCDAAKLRGATLEARVGGAFGGDALTDFFDWNPFSEPPVDPDYKRWVAVEFLKTKTNEEMDQIFADKELGKELLEKLRERFQAQKCWYSPLCCSPSRDDKGKLRFWINTGRKTQIDGSKTLEEIQKFLKSNDKIVDRWRD